MVDIRLWLFPLVNVGATELLIETVELPMAFIGDWGGLDGFERAVPGDSESTVFDTKHGDREGTRREGSQKKNREGSSIRLVSGQFG